MRAVVFDRYGPPEVLRVAEVPDPVPGDREVLIRVKAAEVTKADCELRSFRLPVSWYWLPLRLAMGVFRPRRRILGNYFAGEVVACGREARRFQPGQRIVGCARFDLGAHAELLCLPEHYTLVSMPAALSFAEAAALPLGGLNALHFLRRAELRSGEKILINGAGGSIGMYAVQLAKKRGAEVTAVDAAYKETFLRQCGADHFVDYRRETFWRMSRRYDVILSLVPATPFADALRCLNAGGRYLIGNPPLSNLVRGGFRSRSADPQVIVAFAAETPEELTTLTQMAADGEISALVDRRYPISEAAAAHRRVQSEERLGAVILDLDVSSGRLGAH